MNLEGGAIQRSVAGAAAEAIAAGYLRLRGCGILERNVRVGGGEIDIVARCGSWLLFMEVRYRRSTRFGLPVETINERKRRALRRAAHAYLASRGAWAACWRFDVIAVDLQTQGDIRIRHYPNAVPL